MKVATVMPSCFQHWLQVKEVSYKIIHKGSFFCSCLIKMAEEPTEEFLVAQSSWNMIPWLCDKIEIQTSSMIGELAKKFLV